VTPETETTRSNDGEASARSDSNGSDGGGRKTVVQTAALAVAASAAALVAKRMFSDQGVVGPPRDSESGPRGDDSLLNSMLASGWRAAEDSLLPVAEDAAATVGAYMARSGPEVVRERLLPRFISGFERGRTRGGAGD
jgi:hypothetical protein